MNDIHNPIGCTHPLAIHVNGFDLVVPCGKCYACQLKKDEQYKQRCIAESKMHRYTWQVTLTYSNAHIPKVSFNELLDRFPDEDFKGVKGLQKDDLKNPSVGILDKHDIQLFLKRLRKNLVRIINRSRKEYNKWHETKKPYIKDSELGLRYYCSGEYGPKTLRPHYHLLLWYDLEDITSFLRSTIIKSWSYCSSYRLKLERNSGLVTGDAVSYISGYLSSSVNLPLFYKKFDDIKPFRLASSFPAIGFYKVAEKEIAESFINGTFTTSRINTSTNELVDVPFSSYIVHRFFPKCEGFSNASLAERFDIYKNAFPKVRKFYDYILSTGDVSLCKKFSDVYGLDEISDSSIQIACHEGIIDKNSFAFDFRMNNNLEFDLPKKYLKWTNYRASLACHRFCQKFHVSIDFFINQLDNLYQARDMAALNSQYESQINYLENYAYTSPLDWWYAFDILREHRTLSPPEFAQYEKRLHRAGINFRVYYRYDPHRCAYILRSDWRTIFNSRLDSWSYDDQMIKLSVFKKLSRKLHNSNISFIKQNLEV